eukprot:3345978-Rhodomonas_salina.2
MRQREGSVLHMGGQYTVLQSQPAIRDTYTNETAATISELSASIRTRLALRDVPKIQPELSLHEQRKTPAHTPPSASDREQASLLVRCCGGGL